MPAVGAVWLRAGCGCSCPVAAGWQPGFSDVPGPESLAVSSRCLHLHAGRMVVMAGFWTLSLNLDAHICMCKSGRDPGYTRPLTLCWRVVYVQIVAPFAGNMD